MPTENCLHCCSRINNDSLRSSGGRGYRRKAGLRAEYGEWRKAWLRQEIGTEDRVEGKQCRCLRVVGRMEWRGKWTAWKGSSLKIKRDPIFFFPFCIVCQSGNGDDGELATVASIDNKDDGAERGMFECRCKGERGKGKGWKQRKIHTQEERRMWAKNYGNLPKQQH